MGMIDIDRVATGRTVGRDHTDAGSAIGWAIGVLSAILAGLIIFVGIKYLAPSDEATPTPNSTTTTASNPTPTETHAAVAGPFDGHWVGAVTGDLHDYTADAVIHDDGTTLTGTITYPEFPCSGTWTQTARSGNHVDIHEVITAGSPPCIAETTITLVMKSNGTIAFSVFYSDKYFPTATLSRDI